MTSCVPEVTIEIRKLAVHREKRFGPIEHVDQARPDRRDLDERPGRHPKRLGIWQILEHVGVDDRADFIHEVVERLAVNCVRRVGVQERQAGDTVFPGVRTMQDMP